MSKNSNIEETISKVTYNMIVEKDTYKGNQKNKSNQEKPENEDYFKIIDNLFIVVDGITREKYHLKDKSIAREVSEAFVENFARECLANYCISSNSNDIYKLLVNSFKKANERIYYINQEYISKYKENNLKFFEKPGCVGVVALVHNNNLYYGYFGDCTLFLIRNNIRIILGEKQTKCSHKFFNGKINREKLESNYVNHNKKYGYCVANGDDEAFEYFKVGHIALEEDDVIILSSDGLTNYLLNVDSSDFASESVSNIFINSLNFEGEINKSRNKEYDEFVSRFKKDMSFEENLNMHRLINEHANKYDIKLDDRTLIKIKIIL